VSLQKDVCTTKGRIVHELGHALGFLHEQNRPDRDSFVRIAYENILDGFANQFDKYNFNTTKNFSTPYDYNSIMHSDDTELSKNGRKTIIPPAGIVIIPLASKTDAQILSTYDVRAIRFRYQCDVYTPTQAPILTCVNADPTCSYFSNNKNIYCSNTTNYTLNNVNFRDGKYLKGFVDQILFKFNLLFKCKN